MHKLLAGLITTHELLGSAAALQVAVRLAMHLRARVHRVLAKGVDVWYGLLAHTVQCHASLCIECLFVWLCALPACVLAWLRVCEHVFIDPVLLCRYDFINQEVGGTSEALADLARVTGNSSWLQLAAMFERPCFTHSLARGGVADAIEKMHANTHLPQLLGTMARYEATGEQPLRAAAENFWTALQDGHMFATGGSTTGEVWLRAGALGDAVAPQRAGNYWAHDQAETCVAHNSMRVSRRLLQWSTWASWERALSHASYQERTLYNAVLGTQRGSNPGQMLYMMPLGSGVSKAGIPDAPQVTQPGLQTHRCTPPYISIR